MVGGPENSFTTYVIGVDYDYIPAFDLEIIAGRNFNEDFPSDNEGALMNRRLLEMLEFETPEEALGHKINLGGDTLEIIGVVEDYHQMSLRNAISPLVFQMDISRSFYSFKIETTDYRRLIESLEEPWEASFAGNPLEYFFLDEFYNKQYKSDDQYSTVFSLFSGLAIFIACLGLFGLASFMTVQRTKEIGIRKVLGSSVPNIIILLSRGFLGLVLIANLIAWPLAWWIMDNWIQGFPFRIDLNPFLFIVPGVAVIVIAFLSVGFQTLKAAMLNPADTLKYE